FFIDIIGTACNMRGFITINIQWYITMKKAFSLLALSAVASSAFAQDDNWYVGLDVLNTNAEHKNTVPSALIHPSGSITPTDGKFSDMSRETGFGFNIGKQFTLKDQFAVGVEAEYLSLGSFSSTFNYNDPATGIVLDSDRNKMKVHAFNLNIKPKYYFADTDFYLGATAGVGVYKVDLQVDDGSDWGFNYGIEAGYEITPELSLSAGYRSFMTAIDIEGAKDDLELEFDSFYAGLAYKF
ncbi:porin family protein, partial [Vibrio caribbeanicus]|uniref:porin family protein n=1 Tax=Vibrio caribbeanicus TaxID=701175 RepID=UPI0030DA6FE6